MPALPRAPSTPEHDGEDREPLRQHRVAEPAKARGDEGGRQADAHAGPAEVAHVAERRAGRRRRAASAAPLISPQLHITIWESPATTTHPAAVRDAGVRRLAGLARAQKVADRGREEQQRDAHHDQAGHAAVVEGEVVVDDVGAWRRPGASLVYIFCRGRPGRSSTDRRRRRSRAASLSNVVSGMAPLLSVGGDRRLPACTDPRPGRPTRPHDAGVPRRSGNSSRDCLTPAVGRPQT